MPLQRHLEANCGISKPITKKKIFRYGYIINYNVAERPQCGMKRYLTCRNDIVRSRTISISHVFHLHSCARDRTRMIIKCKCIFIKKKHNKDVIYFNK